MKVVNLWGAPGAGKSTTAFGLLFLLKINEFKVEFAPEFAKDLFYEKRIQNLIPDQTFIFAEQHHRLYRLLESPLDFAICDSPLPLPLIYQDPGYPPEFKPLVMAKFNRFDNLNFLLKRTAHPFDPIGRLQTVEQANQKQQEIEDFLLTNQLDYTALEASPHASGDIFHQLMFAIGNTKPLTIPDLSGPSR